MSDTEFVRLSVPKNVKKGDTVRVRSLVVHPMEGIERSSTGEVIPRKYNFVYKCVVTFNGKEVLTITPSQSVSANPYFAFPFKVTEPGELKIVYMDTSGKQHQAVKKIAPV